jgi:hypothetical protein
MLNIVFVVLLVLLFFLCVWRLFHGEALSIVLLAVSIGAYWIACFVIPSGQGYGFLSFGLLVVSVLSFATCITTAVLGTGLGLLAIIFF